MNTRKQGDVGLGRAIQYFTSKGNTVLLPLTDNQRYDLVCEVEGALKKVEVKHTTYAPRGSFFVSLTIKGGNRKNTSKIRTPLPDDFDLLFVACGDGTNYLVPQEVVGSRHSITLNKAVEKYKV